MPEILIVVLLLGATAAEAPMPAGVATWAVFQSVAPVEDDVAPRTWQTTWTLTLADGTGRLDRGDASACLVDVDRRTLTWIDHATRTWRRTGLGADPASLFGELRPLWHHAQELFRPVLEPIDSPDASSRWRVEFPANPRMTAHVAVRPVSDANVSLWREVMRYCTLFDLDISPWIDRLDTVPGLVAEIEVARSNEHHRVETRRSLEGWTVEAVQPEQLVQPPEGYAERPWDPSIFVSLDQAATLEGQQGTRRAEPRPRAFPSQVCGADLCGCWCETRRVPEVKLSGAWLKAASFELGQHSEVSVEHRALRGRAVDGPSA